MASAPGISSFSPDASQALGREDFPRVAALRAAAFAESETRAMPTVRERPWKYLDVSTLDFGAYAPGAGAERLQIAPGATAVRFGDGGPEARATIEKQLGSAVPYERSKLTALHYAFLGEGVLVQVAANAEGGAPVRFSRHYAGERQLVAPHTLIVTGANSRVSVVEEYVSDDGDLVALPIVEILPGPGSEVRYTAIHRWGPSTRVFAEQRTVTERDSALIGTSVVLGGLVVKSHIESSLIGRGSSSELYAVGVGRASETADFYTIQDHIGPDTRSDLLFKAALKERSRAVYYGLTRVGLGARNADANQVNRNILLSTEARADSDPVLEILTNDVIRVSHGAAAGPVDDEQLFYLQARGIPRPAAEALLVRAFLGQVLDRLPDESLREELGSALEARMDA